MYRAGRFFVSCSDSSEPRSPKDQASASSLKSIVSDSPLERQFVIKSQFVAKRLNPKHYQIVDEHIANNIYLYMGVKVPRLYISSLNETTVLASEILDDYQDLSDLLGGDRFLEALADCGSIEARVLYFKQVLDSKKMTLLGLEDLLVTAAWLCEADVLGRTLDNVGVIPTDKDNEYRIVKIDPGAAELNTPISSFIETVGPDNPFLVSTWHSIYANTPEGLMGNLHFKEVFQDVSLSLMQKPLTHLASISEEAIKHLVYREEYLTIVPKAYLDEVAATLLERQRHFIKQFSLELQTAGQQPLEPVLLDGSALTLTGKQIDKGRSKPKIAVYHPVVEARDDLSYDLKSKLSL